MSRLTERRIAALILSADWLIAAGASPDDAAQALNVPAATMREWREKLKSRRSASTKTPHGNQPH